MAFTIKKVIITGKLPNNCSKCTPFFRDASDFLDIACTLFPWRALSHPWDTRPDWCPLVILAENEKLGVFRYVGKGKIIPSTEMWVDDCVETKAESEERCD